MVAAIETEGFILVVEILQLDIGIGRFLISLLLQEEDHGVGDFDVVLQRFIHRIAVGELLLPEKSFQSLQYPVEDAGEFLPDDLLRQLLVLLLFGDGDIERDDEEAAEEGIGLFHLPGEIVAVEDQLCIVGQGEGFTVRQSRFDRFTGDQLLEDGCLELAIDLTGIVDQPVGQHRTVIPILVGEVLQGVTAHVLGTPQKRIHHIEENRFTVRSFAVEEQGFLQLEHRVFDEKISQVLRQDHLPAGIGQDPVEVLRENRAAGSLIVREGEHIGQEIVTVVSSQGILSLIDLEGTIFEIDQHHPIGLRWFRQVGHRQELLEQLFAEGVEPCIETIDPHLLGSDSQERLVFDVVEQVPVIPVVEIDEVMVAADTPVVAVGRLEDLLDAGYQVMFLRKLLVLVGKFRFLSEVHLIDLIEERVEDL